MLNVMRQHFDQSAKQLIVGHTTILPVDFWFNHFWWGMSIQFVINIRGWVGKMLCSVTQGGWVFQKDFCII